MSGRGRSDDPGYVRMVMELRGKLISLADQGPVMPGARRQVAEARERLLAYAGTPLSTFRGTIESAKARTPPIAENPQPGGPAMTKTMRFLSAGLALVLFGATAAPAQDWKPVPPSQRCPSKWGAGDERGAANHMTPETVMKFKVVAC